MKRLTRIAMLSTILLLGSAGIASAALPPGISGSWYNPQQSGHGLSIDMLSRDRALVSWSAMDLDGHPFNLYTEARVEGERLIGRALAPRGLRFGAWNRADLEVPDWGEIRIDFADCDQATLSWTPDGAAGVGFPEGSMGLRRLTALAGIGCDFGQRSTPPVPTSTLRMRVTRSSDPLPIAGPYFDDSTYAAIDPDGRLLAVETMTYYGDTPAIFPYRNFKPLFLPPTPAVVIGEPVSPGGGPLRVAVRELSVQPVAWTVPSIATGSLTLASDQVRGSAHPQTSGRVTYEVIYFTSDPSVRRAELHPLANRTLDFAGTYTFILRSSLRDYPARLEVDGEGRLCLRLEPHLACEMNGQLELAFTGHAFVDFVIESSASPRERYSGRGWLQRRIQVPSMVELVLVGKGENNDGWGVAGLRQ